MIDNVSIRGLLIDRFCDFVNKGWIDYFLKGVAIQSEEATKNAAAILDLNNELMEKIRSSGRAPRHTQRIYD